MKVIFNNCNLEFNKFVDVPVTDSSEANVYLKNIYFVGLPQSVQSLYLKSIKCNNSGKDEYIFSLEYSGSEYFRVISPINGRNLPYIVRNVTLGDNKTTVVIKSENISNIGDGQTIILNARINLNRATDKYNTIQTDIDAGFTDNPNVNLLVTEMYVNRSSDLKFTLIDNNSNPSDGYGIGFGNTSFIYAYQAYQLDTPNDNTIFTYDENGVQLYAIVKWSLLNPSLNILYETGDISARLLGPCNINFEKATDLHYSPIIRESLEQ